VRHQLNWITRRTPEMSQNRLSLSLDRSFQCHRAIRDQLQLIDHAPHAGNASNESQNRLSLSLVPELSSQCPYPVARQRRHHHHRHVVSVFGSPWPTLCQKSGCHQTSIALFRNEAEAPSRGWRAKKGINDVAQSWSVSEDLPLESFVFYSARLIRIRQNLLSPPNRRVGTRAVATHWLRSQRSPMRIRTHSWPAQPEVPPCAVN
jgi:hypothetical protein